MTFLSRTPGNPPRKKDTRPLHEGKKAMLNRYRQKHSRAQRTNPVDLDLPSCGSKSAASAVG
jgi:hypothetical protein